MRNRSDGGKSKLTPEKSDRGSSAEQIKMRRGRLHEGEVSPAWKRRSNKRPYQNRGETNPKGTLTVDRNILGEGFSLRENQRLRLAVGRGWRNQKKREGTGKGTTKSFKALLEGGSGNRAHRLSNARGLGWGGPLHL